MPDPEDRERGGIEEPDPDAVEAPAPPARAIRPPVAILALLAALAIGLVAPFAHHWLATNAEGQSLFGWTYLPMIQLVLASCVALFWNPLVAAVGIRELAVRGRELLLFLALSYLVAGISSSGMAANWVKTLAVKQDLFKEGSTIGDKRAKNDTYERLYDGYPDRLVLPPEEEAKAVVDALERRRKAIDEGDDEALSEAEAVLRDLPDMDEEEAGAVLALWEGLGDRDQPLREFVDPGEGGPSPMSAAAPPVAWNYLLMVCALLLVFGLIAATARQWTHHERLQHPLIQVPMALTRPAVIFDRRFLVAVGIVFAISLYGVLKTVELNPLPDFKVGVGKPVVKMSDLYKIFGADAPSSARWVYQNQWGAIHLLPAVIGIAFLLSLDVGFSLWGGFWFGALICGYLYRMGIPVDFHSHGRNAGNGAVLAMAVVIAWIGRRHYLRLIQATLGFGGDTGDPLGVWGVRLAVLGFVGFTFCLVAFGIDFWAAVLGLLIFAAFMIVIARVVAESGLANFQTPGHLYQLMHGIGVPHLFPVHAVAMMSWLGATMAYDTRVNVSGFLVQSTAMGDVGGLPRRRLFPVLLFVGLAVAGGALIGEVIAFWSLEGSARLAGGERLFRSNALVNIYENPPREDSGGLGLSVDQWAILVGALLIFACYAVRRIWVGFILNPIGLVVASSWPVMVCWGSLMLGWAAKVLVLRYGGAHLYVRLKPVAYGLVVGHVLGMGLEFVVATCRAVWG